jgi:hypothetical protein
MVEKELGADRPKAPKQNMLAKSQHPEGMTRISRENRAIDPSLIGNLSRSFSLMVLNS